MPRWQQLVFVAAALLILPKNVYTKQPNVVMIVADDLGYHDVGFRESNILTPNIDRLASQAVVLENHIVSASCSPTRAALMTGRYPIRTGFWKGNIKAKEEYGLGLDETLIPEMLKRNGYTTHGVGKWHLGMYTWEHTPLMRGFDTFFGLYQMEQSYFQHTLKHKTDFRENYFNVNGALVDVIREDLKGQYSTYLYTNRSVDLIHEHNQSKPLFLYLAYTAPHLPHQAPKEDVKRFSSHIPDDIRDLEERKRYAAMISIMDEGVGKVVSALTRQGMIDNTILLFTSDNGAYHFGSNYPLRGGKRSYLEGGVRGVSFVSSSLFQKSGYTNTHLHHVTDWYATLQQLVGDTPEKHGKPQLPIDGVDIWKSISNNQSCRDEVLYELRDPLKRLDSTGRRALKNAQNHPVSLKASEVKFRNGRLGSEDVQDFFVIRWKNWKLLTGTGLMIQGWTSESGQREQYRKFKNYGVQDHPWGIASGTFLFDLATDVREEHNLADEHPDIVISLLEKKQGYLDNMKTIYERNYSNNGMVSGAWKPWVEL